MGGLDGPDIIGILAGVGGLMSVWYQSRKTKAEAAATAGSLWQQLNQAQAEEIGSIRLHVRHMEELAETRRKRADDLEDRIDILEHELAAERRLRETEKDDCLRRITELETKLAALAKRN